jgi:cytochrome P450
MSTSTENWTVPEHVPAELVIPYDHIAGPEVTSFPPTSLQSFRDHRIFFSPLYGGFWVLTRYADIRQVFQDPTTFGQNQSTSIPMVPFARPRVPVSLDPPEHMRWRRLMLPLFSAGNIAALEPVLRTAAREQVNQILPSGRCEFISEFALIVPVTRFCSQLGLPFERHQEFLSLADELLYGTTRVALQEGQEAAQKHRLTYDHRIEEIVRGVIEERRIDPGDDIASALVQTRFEERPLSDEEILNILTFLFIAGTDSTSIAIAFAVLHLASVPTDRRSFVERPEIRDSAVEELLRVGSVHQISRVVRHDTELAGVSLRAGDLIALSTGVGGRDPNMFANPNEVELERSPNRHLAFGAGEHRCLGAHQAHLEMKVALEEFHRVIPEYEIDPAESIEFVCAAGKSRPRTVPLVFVGPEKLAAT